MRYHLPPPLQKPKPKFIFKINFFLKKKKKDFNLFKFRDGGRDGTTTEIIIQDEQEGQEDIDGDAIDKKTNSDKEIKSYCLGCLFNHPSQKYHITSSRNKFGCIYFSSSSAFFSQFVFGSSCSL